MNLLKSFGGDGDRGVGGGGWSCFVVTIRNAWEILDQGQR